MLLSRFVCFSSSSFVVVLYLLNSCFQVPQELWGKGAGAGGDPVPILIFYGSSHGTCKDFANKLAADAKAHNFVPRVMGLDELTLTYDFSGLFSKATKKKKDACQMEGMRIFFLSISVFLTPVSLLEEKMVTALVVTCSYNGKPPDNAVKFYNWLHNIAKPAKKGEAGVFDILQYAIFGVYHPPHTILSMQGG